MSLFYCIEGIPFDKLINSGYQAKALIGFKKSSGFTEGIHGQHG